MADNDETPPAAAPKPPARRAPRKSPPAKSASDKPTSKPRRKPAAAASESAAQTASTVKTPTPPKPRSTKRATPPTKRAAKPIPAAAKDEAEKQPVWKSKAALAGGLAAVGAAATAALLSLRGSTAKKDQAAKTDPDQTGKDMTPPATAGTAGAHMPDGQDASKSFEAGIADENVIPE